MPHLIEYRIKCIVLGDLLTPEDFFIMFSPKMLQNCHFSTSTKLYKKKQLWTHKTIEFYSMLVWKDMEKNSEIFKKWQKSFFGHAKNQVAALHKVTFVWKNVQNGSASLN